jgi:hypothetical protein
VAASRRWLERRVVEGVVGRIDRRPGRMISSQRLLEDRPRLMPRPTGERGLALSNPQDRGRDLRHGRTVVALVPVRARTARVAAGIEHRLALLAPASGDWLSCFASAYPPCGPCRRATCSTPIAVTSRRKVAIASGVVEPLGRVAPWIRGA